MGFHIEIICDEPKTYDDCVSKFGAASVSGSSTNDRANVQATISDIRERATFAGWKITPTGLTICPKCARYR